MSRKFQVSASINVEQLGKTGIGIRVTQTVVEGLTCAQRGFNRYRSSMDNIH